MATRRCFCGRVRSGERSGTESKSWSTAGFYLSPTGSYQGASTTYTPFGASHWYKTGNNVYGGLGEGRPASLDKKVKGTC